MMLLRGVAAAYLSSCAMPTFAAGDGSISYEFHTILVPDEVPSGERTIQRNDPWFSGKAFPRRVARTLDSVTIAEQGLTLPQGTVLGLAESDRLSGCSFDLSIKFRMGRSRVCLIDMDRDGRFDHWFRRGGEMTFYPYSSKISLDDILPTGTVAIEEVRDWQSVPQGIRFQARFWWNQLRACTGDPEYELTMQCTTKGAEVLRDGAEHHATFLRGIFRYRYAGKSFVVQTVKPPEVTVGVESGPTGKVGGRQ